jgi:hypothetical protein
MSVVDKQLTAAADDGDGLQNIGVLSTVDMACCQEEFIEFSHHESCKSYNGE